MADEAENLDEQGHFREERAYRSISSQLFPPKSGPQLYFLLTNTSIVLRTAGLPPSE